MEVVQMPEQNDSQRLYREAMERAKQQSEQQGQSKIKPQKWHTIKPVSDQQKKWFSRLRKKINSYGKDK